MYNSKAYRKKWAKDHAAHLKEYRRRYRDLHRNDPTYRKLRDEARKRYFATARGKMMRKRSVARKYKKHRLQILAYHDVYRKRPDKKIAIMFTNYKIGARRRKLVFELSREQFEFLVNSACVYCGKTGLNGIDRLDNTDGYTIDNSASCCSVHNRMKGPLPYNEFIEACISVVAQAPGMAMLA